jgi:hypothetical protein
MKPCKIVVNDLMQKNYVYYLTEKEGKNFAADFKPELTPNKCWNWEFLEGNI